jgi:hypothetical protein
MIIGGLPSCGFGIKTSVWHVSTQLLQPSQMAGSNTTGLVGAGGLGCT